MPLEEHLKLLQFSDTSKQKLRKGSPVALKTSLAKEKLEEEKKRFEKMGLLTEHRLQLNPTIFEIGLKKIDHSPSADLDVNLPIYRVNPKFIPPIFFARPYEGKVDIDKSLIAQINNYQFGSLALIILASIIGLVTQIYVISLATHIGLPHSLATAIGIIFIFSCFLILPRLFQPLTESRESFGNKEIILFEQPKLILGQKLFIWETRNDLGEFSLKPNSAKASSTELLYDWNSQYTLSESSEQAVDRIQGALTGGTLFEIVKTIFDFAKTIRSKLVSSNTTTQDINWDNQPNSYVYDAKGKVVALIYKGEHKAYQIIRGQLSNDLVLHSFCLSIHRAGLS